MQPSRAPLTSRNMHTSGGSPRCSRRHGVGRPHHRRLPADADPPSRGSSASARSVALARARPQLRWRLAV
eukprot:352473-Chlamydomonas_euryale.AAC.17